MREAHPAVAVVLATGVETVHPSISLAGNVVEYLVKPFERATVLTAVGRRALARGRVKKARRRRARPLAAWLQTAARLQDPESK